MNVEETREFVRKHGIPAEFMEHSQVDATTSANAALANGEKPERIIKVLCFVNKSDKFFAILQGSKRVDLKKLGLGKPRMANAQELKLWFDAEPGGVPPIGLPEEILKVVDERLLQEPYVIGSAGSKFVGLKLNPRDLAGQPNTVVKDISEG